jgi:2,3-bisphosphoglycerate-independent phosphoglycerate mutase
MRYFWLVCQAMADDPLEVLDGRTPLEVAKKPFMDQLVREAQLGTVSWIPASLAATGDVAAYSMLGYDPHEFYTGLAPLEALHHRLLTKDTSVVFRCDFVTVSDGELIDPWAGGITNEEARVLIADLNKKLEKFHVKILSIDRHKNLLFVEGAQKAEELDDVETVSPERIRHEKIAKWAPKGKAGIFLRDLMEASKEILENHEVNRVRIDLKENPASMFWLWGQGRRPKLPPLQQRMGVEGAFWSQSDAWRGLALAAGLKTMKEWNEREFSDLNIAYWQSEEAEFSKDHRAKIRRIEEFDARVVGAVIKFLKKSKDQARILVTSDVLQSTDKGANTHAHSPILWWGLGAPPAPAEVFSEKSCGQAATLYEPGHAFMQAFLKDQGK